MTRSVGVIRTSASGVRTSASRARAGSSVSLERDSNSFEFFSTSYVLEETAREASGALSDVRTSPSDVRGRPVVSGADVRTILARRPLRARLIERSENPLTRPARSLGLNWSPGSASMIAFSHGLTAPTRPRDAERSTDSTPEVPIRARPSGPARGLRWLRERSASRGSRAPTKREGRPEVREHPGRLTLTASRIASERSRARIVARFYSKTRKRSVSPNASSRRTPTSRGLARKKIPEKPRSSQPFHNRRRREGAGLARGRRTPRSSPGGGSTVREGRGPCGASRLKLTSRG